MPMSHLNPPPTLILDQVGDAVITTAPDFTVTSWNRAATELYGFDATEAIGGSVLTLLRTEWESEADRQAALTELQTVGVWRGEVKQSHRDGRRLDVRSEVRVLRDANGTVLGAVATNQDITARRRAEAALANLERHLIEVQRAEVLGRLTSNVAHDFNNILGIIQGNADLALLPLPPEHASRRSLGKVHDIVDRASTLSRQLLLVSRGQDHRVRALDLVATVRGIEEVLRCLVGSSNRLKIELPNTQVLVTASVSELQHVLINLCMNARESLATAGTVTIRVAANPDEATITVSDTGTGMSPEICAQAAEPFFTTRGERHASGLGLTVVGRIAAAHHGHLAIRSTPDVGTEVSFALPLAEITDGR